MDFAPVITFLLSTWTIRFTKEGTYSVAVLGTPSLVPITDGMAAGWSFHRVKLGTAGKRICV